MHRKVDDSLIFVAVSGWYGHWVRSPNNISNRRLHLYVADLDLSMHFCLTKSSGG
jgi:hypothetical protein